MSDKILTIQKGLFSLGINPSNGGCLTHFTMKTGNSALTNIFAPATKDHPASCIMTPIGNRQPCVKIINGEERRVGPQFGKETGNYLHGDGWKASWAVKEHGDDYIILAHSKKKTPDSCDSYDAEQEFRLIGENTLLMGVSVTNTDTDDLAAGPGHHPWFPRDEMTIVKIDAPDKKVWLFDYDMRLQPESLVDLPKFWDFNGGVRMMDPRLPEIRSIGDIFLMDSCLPNVKGIRIIQPRDHLEVIMTSSREGHAVVYNPTLEKDFCVVEAVPSIPYAEQLMKQGVKDTGATVLKTGETMKFDTYLQIKPL